MSDSLPNCHDCGVSPGTPHVPGCDVARCLQTGRQAISCGQKHDHGDEVWTGVWPGDEDAIRLGLYCYENPGGNPWWVPCEPDHPDARPDLNRLPQLARWDREARRWEMR